jgi:uncharacterized membrane protein affecting hemolysin expression
MPLTLLKKLTPTTGNYRLPALMVMISLGILLLTSYLFSQQQQNTASGFIDQYGESIAKLTADRVASSTLNQDAISLQAIAQNISNQSIATSVVIYTIDNTILAQANDTNTSIQQTISHFTSPIVSSNNIIGSVTIGISPALFLIPPQLPITLILSILLVTCLAITYYKNQRQLQIPFINKPVEESEPTSILDTNTDLDNSAPSTTILLTLKIQNLGILYQQLNGESRKQQLKQLEKSINHALTLYNGNRLITTSDSITLGFNHKGDDNIFNALYSGELILKLNEKTPSSIIILNAMIQIEDSNDSLSHTLDSARKCSSATENKHALFITQTLIDTYQLDARLALENVPNSSGTLKISHLKGHYKVLLENQLNQLQQEI